MSFHFESCSSRPQTAAGAAYLRVALDPCGESLPPEFKGIPDGSETDIVLLRMRDDLVLEPPSDLDPSGLWGLVIFDTPYFIYQQTMVRYRSVDGPPSSDLLREYINGIPRVTLAVDGPISLAAATYPGWVRPVRRVIEDFTNINEPLLIFNILAAARFEISFLKPAVLDSFSASPVAPGWSFIRKFRCAAKGRTLHLNAPATATQGRVVCGQLGTESSVKIVQQLPEGVNNLQRPYPARFTVTPPFDFNQLPQQDLNCRQDIIKTGEYSMQRHWNGSHTWNEIEDVRPIWRANLANLASMWLIPPAMPGVESGSTNSQLLFKYDGFDVNLGWVVTHIDGMSSQATVHMKHRSVWEINVPGSSPWAANKMAPCLHDSGALSLEKQIGPCIPHSYEAKYNDLGLLAAAIRQVTSIGKQALGAGINSGMSALLRGGRKVVIDDPYAGPSLYGDSGFTSAGGRNGNGNGKTRNRNGKRK